MLDPTCPIAVKIRFLDVVQGLWIECQQILDLNVCFSLRDVLLFAHLK